jgi:type IV secretory pathway VirB2 component (pilin)
MDHEDVLEQLELAAVEPGGLDRLMAGDTAMAAAVVGHLAGCDTCAEELRRLSRAAPLLRDLVRTTPPEDLRERTLAYVRERGRPRGAAAVVAAAGVAGGTTEPIPLPVAAAASTDGRRRGLDRILPWFATAAAVLALLVAGLTYVSGRAELERQAAVISGMERLNVATLAITGDPESGRVELVSTTGASTAGTLLFSPSTTELTVVATDLEEPPSGKEWRCWVEVDGVRQNVGKMFYAEDLAFWVGETEAVSDLPAGTTFGVSLTDVGGSSLDADPILSGEL